MGLLKTPLLNGAGGSLGVMAASVAAFAVSTVAPESPAPGALGGLAKAAGDARSKKGVTKASRRRSFLMGLVSIGAKI